ncbi:MAG: PqiC family protein [Steroidobacteraceae bacterium]
MKSLTAAFCSCLLCACAAVQPDHYHILSAQPPGELAARSASAKQVLLRVSLPSLVDRPEMVLNTAADAVTVLEHERWAASLTDLAAQTLARDLERRRADLLVTGPGLSRPGGPPLKVTVEVVQMTARRGGQVSIDAHWRISDMPAGKETVGGEVFNASVAEEGYAAVALALSDCLGLLADRLIAQLPPAE